MSEKTQEEKKLKLQTSETFRLGAMLAISGGLMDAYSYLVRGQVFANAQTGNILLLGVNLSHANYSQAFRYFCPVISFAVGIFMADMVRHKSRGIVKLHWRQLSVLIEAAALLVVAFIPLTMNLAANCITSLACGVQVESFRKIHGNGIATTMCIGNLRSGTQNLFNWMFNRERNSLKKCVLYYGIIITFTFGAILGSFAVDYLGEKTILISSALLFISFVFMFEEKMETLGQISFK